MIHIEHPVWSAVLFTIENIQWPCQKIAAQGRSLQFYHWDWDGDFDGEKNFAFILINAYYHRHSLLLTLKLIMTWLVFLLNPLFIWWMGQGRKRWRKAKVRCILECFVQGPKSYHTQNWRIHGSKLCPVLGSSFRLRYFFRVCYRLQKWCDKTVWKVSIEVG